MPPVAGFLGFSLWSARTHICGPRCRGSPRGWARGVSGPSFMPVGLYPYRRRARLASNRQRGSGSCASKQPMIKSARPTECLALADREAPRSFLRSDLLKLAAWEPLFAAGATSRLLLAGGFLRRVRDNGLGHRGSLPVVRASGCSNIAGADFCL